MEQLVPLIKDLAGALDAIPVRCAFGGALANNYWGIVRTTLDVDCLIYLPALQYQRLADELTAIGCEMRDSLGAPTPLAVPQMRAQIDERKLIECFRNSIRVELFVPVVPLQEEILRRAVRMPFGDQEIPVTTAEDLILLKLVFHRAKDLQDVQGILWVQRGKLDLDYLNFWSLRTLEADVQQELTTLIEQYANLPSE